MKTNNPKLSALWGLRGSDAKKKSLSDTSLETITIQIITKLILKKRESLKYLKGRNDPNRPSAEDN
jgi:hypothetical protein